MRIGIDARFFGPLETGIGRYVERLVTHLSAIDTPHEYVLFLRKRGFDWWQPPNGRWKKVLADIHWYGMAEQRVMPSIFRRAKLDLLHVPHFNVPLLTRQPFVVTIHDLILDEFPTERATTLEPLLFALKFRAYETVVRHAVRNSKAIISVSEYSKQQLIKRFHVSPAKVHVTHESVDPLPEALPFSMLAERGVQQPYILHVGNAYPHKNLERLLSAVDIANRHKLQFQLVLVGKDNYFLQRLKAEVKKRGLTNVLFFGFATEQELATLYQHARAYIFPSLSEGFGLPGLEAMQVGAPVFAAKASSLPEVYGDAAAYFDPHDPASIAQSIDQALRDTLVRQRLITAGHLQVQQYSWRRMAEQTARVYDYILNNGKINKPKN